MECLGLNVSSGSWLHLPASKAQTATMMDRAPGCWCPMGDLDRPTSHFLHSWSSWVSGEWTSEYKHIFFFCLSINKNLKSILRHLTLKEKASQVWKEKIVLSWVNKKIFLKHRFLYFIATNLLNSKVATIVLLSVPCIYFTLIFISNKVFATCKFPIILHIHKTRNIRKFCKIRNVI